jgi:hypothetical protein
MTYEQIRKKIVANLTASDQDDCVSALADIVMDMYVSSDDFDEHDNNVWKFDIDKEVSGADFVDQAGDALLEGGLNITELLQCTGTPE